MSLGALPRTTALRPESRLEDRIPVVIPKTMTASMAVAVSPPSPTHRERSATARERCSRSSGDTTRWGSMQPRVLAARRAAWQGRLRAIFVLLWVLAVPATAVAQQPLASWNTGPAKTAILDFVRKVTQHGSPNFVPPAERIAVFDNDGTLWSEQPIYFQLAFALDRVKALAPQHPEWKTTQPFKAVLDGDMQAVVASGQKGVLELVMATHTGMTTDEFTKTVSDWVVTARHPRFNRPYTDLVFQPMLELLAYLRANGFKTFIVSGGTVEFMRAWVERVYGIPPEQVVGTTFVTKFELRPDSTPVLVREPKIDFIDDGPGKPVG